MKTFYKKVLVISDNHFLCNQFYEVIQKHGFSETTFTFSISPFSDLSHFKIGNHIEPQVSDLRKADDVAAIVNNFDLILSIHCKQIFPEALVDKIKCINIHPGYNPINRGWYPQVFAIINQTEVGATIHEIDHQIDHGKIIARELVPQFSHDTSDSLYNRILDKEIELLDQHLESIIGNNYQTIEPENEGNLYLKKDFNALLELDLQEKASLGDLINRLRALTHGDFKNAYFIDPETGKRVYVGIHLTPKENE